MRSLPTVLLPALLAAALLRADLPTLKPLTPLLPAPVSTAPSPIDRVIRVGIEDQGMPFSFRNADGEPDGFSVELLREIARSQGLRLEFTVKSWPEILASYNQGEFDLLGNVAYSSQREGYIDFSATKLVMRGGLFQLSDRAPIRDIADLKGLRIAALRDSLGHIYASRQQWNATIIPVDNRSEAIQMLRERRCDAVVMMALVMNHFLRVEGAHDVVQSELPLDELNYRLHYGVKPHNSRILRAINEGLLECQRDGAYNRLYEKWLGPLQPRQLEWRDIRPYSVPAAMVGIVMLVVIGAQRRMLRRVRQQAEAVRESEERLKLVLESGRHGFWDWEIATGVVRRDDLIATMLGYTPGQMESTHQAWMTLVHPDDRDVLARAGQSMIDEGDETKRLTYRMRAASGAWHWIQAAGKVSVRAPDGRALRATGTDTDITTQIEAEEENQRLQQKMVETQRLESLGVLAGGIAHDFNNLLTVIMANVDLVRSCPGDTDENRHQLTQALTASHRAADLCRQLLSYAGQGNFTLTRTNLNDIVRETTNLIEGQVRIRATLRMKLDDNLPHFDADHSQIQQVVMNLVLNAAEAMPPTGGLLLIETSAVPLVPGQLSEALPAPPASAGLYVCLKITDNGSGMPPEVRARIFDPFFTTKFTGRGLGLAAVLGIVRSHRGALTVRSQPGAGTTFCVYLPVAGTTSAHSVASPAI